MVSPQIFCLLIVKFQVAFAPRAPDLTENLKMVVIFGEPTVAGAQSSENWENCLEKCWDTWNCVVSFANKVLKASRKKPPGNFFF